MSMAFAAGFLVDYGTTLTHWYSRANLKAGETLLVLGAAGGVGLTAIEIGKALGARVLAAASATRSSNWQSNTARMTSLTTRPIPSRHKVKEFTAVGDIDVAYDPVGGDCAEQCVRSMAWNGRYLVIGFTGGKIPAIPLNLPLLKGCSVVGVFWGTHTRREPELHAANIKALFKLFEEGVLRPHVTEMDGLDHFTDALELLNSRRATGKVVIRVAGDA